MGFLPKNFFGSKKSPAPALTGEARQQSQEAKESKSAGEKTIPKPRTRAPVRALRGSNGKFISPDKVMASKEESSSSRLESIMTAGHSLRTFRFENERYYCVDDLVKAAGAENQDEELENLLKKNQTLASSLAEVQVDEDGKKFTLQFATKQTTNQIIAELGKLPQEIVLKIRNLN